MPVSNLSPVAPTLFGDTWSVSFRLPSLSPLCLSDVRHPRRFPCARPIENSVVVRRCLLASPRRTISVRAPRSQPPISVLCSLSIPHRKRETLSRRRRGTHARTHTAAALLERHRGAASTQEKPKHSGDRGQKKDDVSSSPLVECHTP